MAMDSQEIRQWLATLKFSHKVFMLLGVAVLLTSGYWYVCITPRQDTIRALRKDIAKINGDIERFKNIARQIPALEQRRNALNTELGVARTLVSGHAQALEKELASFEVLARKTGVDVISFTPGKETIGPLYASREVNLHLQGNFHHLMCFFDELSRRKPLVELTFLRLLPLRQQAEGDGILLTADSRLVVFRALTHKEQEAAARAGTKQGRSTPK